MKIICIFIVLSAHMVFSSDLYQIQLYCFYTPQFERLYKDYFLPSIQDDFKIVVRQFEQECPTGAYRSEGWDKTMLRKLELLRYAVKKNWGGKIFVYSDVDIIFLKPVLPTLLDQMQNVDLAIQQGWPAKGICAGFFAMKGNKRTLKFIDYAIELLQNQICTDDQLAMKKALADFGQEKISWTFLPSKQFPNGNRVLKKRIKGGVLQYTPGAEIVLDPSILLFHANCTKGLENKYCFLNEVLEQFLIQSQNP